MGMEDKMSHIDTCIRLYPRCSELSNDKRLQIAEDQSHNNCMNSCDGKGLVEMSSGDIARQPVKRQTLKLRFGS